MKSIDGKTKITGLFGNPVSHTLSPAMQNAAFEALGINAVYAPFLVLNEDLGKAVAGARALNFLGFNVTVPHKEKIMRCLDGLDPLAKKIGSVNTVVSSYGKLTGYNTDATGFVKSLSGKFTIKNKKALVLGAGGAGKAIIFSLLNSGARCVYVYDLDKKKAAAVSTTAVGSRELIKTAEDADLIVNATPAGMRVGAPAINPDYLKKEHFVYDIVYNRETELIKEAKKRKIAHLSGIEMLLYQGADAFELWTERKAPVGVMRKALLRALKH